MSRPFPAHLPAEGYGPKTPKQNFRLSLKLVDHHLCQECSCRRQVLLHWEFFIPCPCSSTQHTWTLTPLTDASGAEKTQASYICQRHRRYLGISKTCKKIERFKAKEESCQFQLKSSDRWHKHWQRYSQSHLLSALLSRACHPAKGAAQYSNWFPSFLFPF